MSNLRSQPQFEEHGYFIGFEPRQCGEHRTVGDYRAWCFDCGEWCYPKAACIRCLDPDGLREMADEMETYREQGQ